MPPRRSSRAKAAKADDDVEPTTAPSASAGSKRRAPPQAPGAKRSRGGAGKVAASAAAAPAQPTPTGAPQTGTSKKVGLSGAAPPSTTAPLGTVDAGLAKQDAALAARAIVRSDQSGSGLLRDAKLVLVDPAKNTDKYYILQLLEDPSPSPMPTAAKGKRKAKAAPAGAGGAAHYVFSRWGRTGTGGQCKLDGPMDLAAAEAAFDKIYTDKTGAPGWGPPCAPRVNKYTHLQTAASLAAAGASTSTSAPVSTTDVWQYYLSADPLGKPDGWYDYDPSNSQEVETLYRELAHNPSLGVRFVTSESSGFTYKVDLFSYQQTNTASGKVRSIRRAPPGAGGPPPPAPGAPGAGRHTTPPIKPSAAPPRPAASPSAGSLAGTVDAHAPPFLLGGMVVNGFDATLNQTNLGANANKFIKVQLIRQAPGSGVTLHRRWGRVGEAGQQKQEGPFSDAQGELKFKSYFRSKTGWEWDDRADAPPAPAGKYGLVDMETDEAAAKRQLAPAPVNGASSAHPTPAKQAPPATLPCTLDTPTQALVDLIFEKETFESAMTALELDPQRLPLGALSKAQIERGEKALEAVEAALAKGTSRAELARLTSAFFTIIPHAFGRRAPPVLDTQEAVDVKFDMLNTLRDIDEANQMVTRAAAAAGPLPARPHPADEKVQQLHCDLTTLAESDPELALIRTYLEHTKGGGGGRSLRTVWRVDRHGEAPRFAAHDALDNRRLLWHGTNVAVVAAILKSGLRIMPHSGGRVGKGIYLADMHEKSAGYVRPVPTRGGRGGHAAIMFLVEAALGKAHEVTADGEPSRYTSAPAGCDSVLAVGRTQPDPTKDVRIKIDGRPVTMPQGARKDTGVQSSFHHNEYLVYKETQHRIRYVLLFDW